MIALAQFDGSGNDFDGGRYTLMNLRVGDLKIDARYQRAFIKAHIKYLVANFDWYLLDPLVVSRRADGTMYVMDGQHRLLALRELGYDDQPVRCMVFDGLSLEQESRRFNTQDTRKALTAMDRFRARLLEGQSAEMAVAEVVRSTGFVIDFNGGGNKTASSLVCVGALLQAYKAGGAAHLRQVLSIIALGYGAAASPDSVMVNGLSSFLRRYDGEFDESRLIEVMRRVTPEQVAREARNIQTALRASGKNAYAMAVVAHYNRKLSNHRLPEFAAKSGGR